MDSFEGIDDEELDMQDQDPQDNIHQLQRHAQASHPRPISGMSSDAAMFKQAVGLQVAGSAFDGGSLQSGGDGSNANSKRWDSEVITAQNTKASRHHSADEGPAGSPSSSSIFMLGHGRSLSGSSSNSEKGMYALDTWDRHLGPSTGSPRGSALGSASTMGTSPVLDSYTTRRRSLGQSSSRSGSSPTYSSFSTYHTRAAHPSSPDALSPAFGASTPPTLPLHAHLEHAHQAASTEEVVAHLSQSPHLHAQVTPSPPPDADEPWIDLPPAIDASFGSPRRESPLFPATEMSTSPSSNSILASYNHHDRRSSDPQMSTRSPALLPTRKANSSPMRASSSLLSTCSLSQSGQFGSPEALQKFSLSPSSSSTHRRLGSDDELTSAQSPRLRSLFLDTQHALLSMKDTSIMSSPADITPTSHLPLSSTFDSGGTSPHSGRSRTPTDLAKDLALSRQRSLSPKRLDSPKLPGPTNNRRSSHRRSPSIGTTENGIFALSDTTVPLPSESSPSGQESPARLPPPPAPLPSAVVAAGEGPGVGPPAQLFPPMPHHDLSLPPRSGWELSDDDDASPSDDEAAQADSSHRDSQEEGSEDHHRDLAELQLDMSPSSPTMGTIPLPLLDTDENKDSPEWGAPLDFNRAPAVEIETLSPEDSYEMDTPGDDGFHIDVEDEGLTPLERIFLFAKSEHSDHRETVSRLLPSWIKGVEICEAVDYILPLFQALVNDEDHVKEAFANSLDELMWFFFSHCPLVELSAQQQIIKLSASAIEGEQMQDRLHNAYREGASPSIAVSQGGLQLFETSGPSVADVPQANGNGQVSRDSMDSLRAAFAASRSDITGNTPISGSTLVESDTPDTMLGDEGSPKLQVIDRPLLPLDTFYSILAPLLMNEISTVSAVTQEALVRFLLRLEGKELPFSEPHDEDYSTDEMPSVQDDLKRPHAHQPYEISTSARERIRNDLLDEIIIPLFRMDDRPSGYASLWKDSSVSGNEAVSPQDYQTKFSQFFDDPKPSVSPPAEDEPDSQQAVFVGLTMVALLSETNCLPLQLVEEKLLPLVAECGEDPSIVMKKQTAEVLASMSKAVTEEAVTSIIAPIVDSYSLDNSPTIRRIVATILPDIVKKIIAGHERRYRAVTMAQRLANDAVTMVRQAFLEISGPLIYIFKDDVPDELIDCFTGNPTTQEASTPSQEIAQDTFAPLIPTFAATTSESGQDTTETSSDLFGWSVQGDHGRAIITAYNLPGVCLSLGRTGWPRLKALHAALALESTVSQPRYLIASSIHDVASIVGPEQSAEDLLPLYKRLATDDDAEVVMRGFERFAEFAHVLPDSSMEDMASLLSEVWKDRGLEDWRLREVLAESLVAVASRPLSALSVGSMTSILDEGLRDRITAVRSWAIQAVPVFLGNLRGESAYHQDLLQVLLSLADNAENHKHRATFCLCLLAILEGKLSLSPPLWMRLVSLAPDPVVDVRIVAARCLAKASQPGQQFALHPPEDIAGAVRSLKEDSSICVKEEVSSVDLRTSYSSLDQDPPSQFPSDSSSSSSDDDDDETPSAHQPTEPVELFMPGHGGSSANGADDTAQSQDSSSAKEDPGNSGKRHSSDGDVPMSTNDDVDDDSESLDLESSTIYELDLEDLASSSIYLPPSPAPPQRSSRETPPLRPSSSNSSIPSILSSTPPRGPCMTERHNSWHVSMRDEEQYVAIDVTGNA